MPTNNERLLSFLEVKRIIKRFNRKALASLQHAIDSDQTGIVFAYIHGLIKVIIKRYRTGAFIGILENV